MSCSGSELVICLRTLPRNSSALSFKLSSGELCSHGSWYLSHQRSWKRRVCVWTCSSLASHERRDTWWWEQRGEVMEGLLGNPEEVPYKGDGGTSQGLAKDSSSLPKRLPISQIMRPPSTAPLKPGFAATRLREASAHRSGSPSSSRKRSELSSPPSRPLSGQIIGSSNEANRP